MDGLEDFSNGKKEKGHGTHDCGQRGRPDRQDGAGPVSYTHLAFDYSKKMIELAKRRQSQYAKQIEDVYKRQSVRRSPAPSIRADSSTLSGRLSK